MSIPVSRRQWLTRNVAMACATGTVAHAVRSGWFVPEFLPLRSPAVPLCSNAPQTVDDREALVQHAVAAAQQAGAQYADARLTWTLHHIYGFGMTGVADVQGVGIGVRALINGSWGFAALPSASTADAERLAQAAVAQAAINAHGVPPKTVDLGQVPAAVGRWATPVSIDPFTVPIEEKHAFMRYWDGCTRKVGLAIDVLQSNLRFKREERVIATSDGSCFTQTVYESGGKILLMPFGMPGLSASRATGYRLPIQGIETAGSGWELFLQADIPGQIQAMPDAFRALDTVSESVHPAAIGRYTLVCDGATMAAMLSATFGVALQLDRALGYEANAEGTSFFDDPLAMLGAFKVAAPLVTVTANRSAPAQLATVHWDDEGVAPRTVTLIRDGVVTDFQTTREQAAWLAPYYTKIGQPIQSNACAAAESALAITMQHMPNLALAPGHDAVRLDDLIANVQHGLFLERAEVKRIDFQARNGLLIASKLREIRNGRLGAILEDGAIQFNTLEFWKNLTTVGGASTAMVVPFPQYPYGGAFGALMHLPVKGEPPQQTSHSAQAVAAVITNQPLINPSRKA